MAFYIGTDKVISDTDAGAGISTSSDLDKLQINGVDVLTHSGGTITLKNVVVQDAMESSINTDNLTEGSTNIFFTDARAVSALSTITAAATTDRAAIRTEFAAADTAQTTSINTAWAAADTAQTASITTAYEAYVSSAVTSGTGSLDTDDIAEASNLYFTNARADARAQLKIDALIDSAPGALDTLNELAAALGDDASFSTTITNLIGAETTRATAAEGVNTTAITNLSASTTSAIAALNHDTLSGFVANEHIDWTAASAGTIDPSNYVNTGNTTYTAGNGLTLNTTEFVMSGSYTGNFTATGDITAYSDERLKRNIETINNPIDLVNCLRGVNFEKDGRHSTGVIAQEVEEFLPEVVHTDSEGMKSVAYGNIAGLLIEAIKEQQGTIEGLQKQLTDLKENQNKE